MVVKFYWTIKKMFNHERWRSNFIEQNILLNFNLEKWYNFIEQDILLNFNLK